ncbi:hypothetical protein [Mesorhizobium sp.]|uniref:hypothetical protein n=1 Tax=Mesorhizobium sp. TaxID=1871066 RepID=UPI0025BF4C5E|nr:hypothetical protein [Mesorhizobium sp.]
MAKRGETIYRQGRGGGGRSSGAGDALDEQVAERRKRPQSRVCLATHETFGVRPTSFADFRRRHAAVFRGEIR